MRLCSITRCIKKHKGLGYCKMHLYRFKTYGCPHALKYNPKGAGTITKFGYRRFKIGKNSYFEHRMVMEEYLGRKLKPTECIHHINHDKLDNRLENLVVMTRIEHDRLHGDEKSVLYKKKLT